MSLRALVFACAALASSAAAEPAPQPITLGESYTVPSDVMGTERTINVYLPTGYDKGEARYPVLYLIDGGTDQDFVHVVGASVIGGAWGRSQDAIIVGIATRDRRDELTGPTTDPALLAKYPTAGHSERFRRFIRDEVKPLIAERYRTNGTDGVIGESLAGLFIAETWLREPDLFGSYAAISPSLWWDKGGLLDVAQELGDQRRSTHPLFVATAEEGDAESAFDAGFYASTLAVAEQDICFVRHPEYTHATIYHAVVPSALQFLFPTPEKLDPQYGFTTGCPETSE